jgi:formylglycine-generating enzyme required for sulfatase activity
MKAKFYSDWLIALALFASCALQAGPTVYVGNSLAPVQNAAASDFQGLVILGEYNPAGPLPSSTITLPPGTIQDVKFYVDSNDGVFFNDNDEDYYFTLYVLSYNGAGSNANEQQFRVVSASQWLYGRGQGIQTVPIDPPLTVPAGDLLAFSGGGPFYPAVPNDAVHSDATYNGITPGGAGTVFSVGTYTDTNADFQYINDAPFGNQGRTYAIGVDILPATTNSCISIQCPSNIAVSTCDVYGGLAVDYPQVTATDTCCTNPVILVYSPEPGTQFPAGTTNTVQITAYDYCGNVSACSFTITVAAGPNTNPPVINCPSNIVVTGSAYPQVSYDATASSAFCNDVSVDCYPPSGSYFPAGTTTVNCVAADCCGNTSTCDFTVTVIPGNNPILPQTTALSISQEEGQVVLFWPNSTTNWVLQSTPSLSPTAWSAVSTVPVVINGTNRVTNAISDTRQFYRLALVNPSGMALIPAGAFASANGLILTVSAFYMDTNLVSYSQWQTVYNWATNHGYGFDNAGFGKAANHPVQTVDWYDVVKWSNARSQQAGLPPVYYSDTNLTQVYTNGDTVPYTNSAASGYRLPTEVEWEKAARGGLAGQTFPWGNTISQLQANYNGNIGSFCSDVGPNGYNPAFTNGTVQPFTSPVGYFPPNGYGLYDMAGNVFEWCWERVLRGGGWDGLAIYASCAYTSGGDPNIADGDAGFRCVRGF